MAGSDIHVAFVRYVSRYVSSSVHRAYCYAELAVFSLAVAQTTTTVSCRW